jgi:hypothetical protein
VPGAGRGAESEPRIPPLTAGGKRAQAVDEFMQHFRGFVMVAFLQSNEPVAAEGVHVRDVVVFHRMTSSARPGVAEGGEREDSRANASGFLQGLVV